MMRPAGLLPTAALLFLTGHAVHALADQRVEAVVQETKVTHCDATKIGGCAGTLTLKRAGGGKGDSLAVRVPLGTPISCDGERVLLHALTGKTVVVTLSGDGRDRIARAIQIAEAEPC